MNMSTWTIKNRETLCLKECKCSRFVVWRDLQCWFNQLSNTRMFLFHVLRLIMITDQITRPNRDALAMVSPTTCSPVVEDNNSLDATSNVMVNTQKSVNASGVTSPSMSCGLDTTDKPAMTTTCRMRSGPSKKDTPDVTATEKNEQEHQYAEPEPWSQRGFGFGCWNTGSEHLYDARPFAQTSRNIGPWIWCSWCARRTSCATSCRHFRALSRLWTSRNQRAQRHQRPFADYKPHGIAIFWQSACQCFWVSSLPLPLECGSLAQHSRCPLLLRLGKDRRADLGNVGRRRTSVSTSCFCSLPLWSPPLHRWAVHRDCACGPAATDLRETRWVSANGVPTRSVAA